MEMMFQLLSGVIACGLLIILARLIKPENELKLYALSLMVAALIYVGFSARGATIIWLALELTGLAVFTLLALLGLKVSASFLALGWAAHAAWDVALHKLLYVAFVPSWYPFVCGSFDLLLAGYIIVRFKKEDS